MLLSTLLAGLRLIILPLTTVVMGNVIWDLDKETIMEEEDWQRWRMERRLKKKGIMKRLEMEERRGGLDEGWKEIKIIQVFSQPTLLKSNTICPKRRRERTNLKDEIFISLCYFFFCFNRHRQVIISWSGGLRRCVLISSGGESL